ncbi:hypothetical protein TSUD_335280 [Trifolium subterraneum]|uniref:Uncharacterized protein n=1 Tax=Trifolium subterraneum TaxID=3900 RepID=A0A2Z6NLL0_TRISU|nr:hypothetical protein TSUD_335280 [Trifolium subterraneum]
MLKSVTTVLHEVTRPKPDLESESELEDSYDSSDEYDDDSENERLLTKADALYLKISRNLSVSII